MLRTALYLVLLLVSVSASGAGKKPAPDTANVPHALRDTAEITISKPGADKEQNLFSDAKLKYKQQEGPQDADSESFLNWLANKLFKKAGYENVNTTRQIIIWAVVILSVIMIVWLLSRSSLTGLTRSTPASSAFNFKDISESLDTIDYAKNIREALAAHNYRLAIRWHYLEMLYLLDQKKLISFVPYKTNVDYRYELSDKAIQQTFISLSRIYDYIWYGEFVTNEAGYQDNASVFSTFKQQLNVPGK